MFVIFIRLSMTVIVTAASCAAVIAAVVIVAVIVLRSKRENTNDREAAERGSRYDPERGMQTLSAKTDGPLPSEEDVLLSDHMPVYHEDYREKIPVVSLNRYVEDKTVVADDTVTAVATRRPAGEGWSLHYFSYYDYDGGLIVGPTAVDAHRYDMEHVVVELDRAGKVSGVLYQPHGSAEHFWIRGTADLDRILVHGTRPLVFASRGKHGSYPLSGLIYRYGGFASDTCQRPVLRSYTPVPPSAKVLRTERVDGVFPSVPPKLRANLDGKPIVQLDRVRTRMMFKKFW